MECVRVRTDDDRDEVRGSGGGCGERDLAVAARASATRVSAAGVTCGHRTASQVWPNKRGGLHGEGESPVGAQVVEASTHRGFGAGDGGGEPAVVGAAVRGEDGQHSPVGVEARTGVLVGPG